MTEQTTKPASTERPQPIAPNTDRAQRRYERAERRAARRSGAAGTWIAGLVFIGLGVLLLFQNMTNVLLVRNWWALFILIPAAGALAKAWSIYREAEYLTAAARSALIGALVLVLVATAFLLELNWGIFGPVLIILAGVGLLLNTVLPGEPR